MKTIVGNYKVKFHVLDEKITINVQSIIEGEVILETDEQNFISLESPMVYDIINSDFEDDIYVKQKIKHFGDFIVSFEQTKEGKLKIWYAKLDLTHCGWVSRKKIDGETLTIAHRKEVGSQIFQDEEAETAKKD